MICNGYSGHLIFYRLLVQAFNGCLAIEKGKLGMNVEVRKAAHLYNIRELWRRLFVIFAHVVKNFFYLIALLGLLSSCTTTRKSYPGSNSAPPPKQLPRDPKFLENISIKPEEDKQVTVGSSAPLSESVRYIPGMAFSTNIENCNPLQFKYAIMIDEPVEKVTNERLITFLESWFGIPYKFGGEGRMGVDCSAFTAMMLDSVYGIALPRTAASQYEMGVRIKKEQLEQGDLIFFNTTGGISHVGMFLANRKFVHAASSTGVTISDLEDPYYKKRFIGATRVK